jgi:hypothetical protein
VRDSQVGKRHSYRFLTRRYASLVAAHYLQEEAAAATFRTKGRSVSLPARTTKRLGGCWISLCDPASSNWMHWLSEILPTAVAQRTDGHDSVCGFLYDQTVPESALRSLKLIAQDRPIVALSETEAALVDCLNHVPRGWSVFWQRKIHLHNEVPPARGVFSFDAESIFELRRRLLESLGIIPEPKAQVSCVRSARWRRAVNSDVLQTVLGSRRFQSIDPGRLNFESQVEAFAKARIVVGQSGAALANMMFMPKGAVAILFYADTPFANPAYWQAYGEVFGVRVYTVPGHPIPRPDESESGAVPFSGNHAMHSDFEAPIDQIVDLVENLE